MVSPANAVADRLAPRAAGAAQAAVAVAGPPAAQTRAVVWAVAFDPDDRPARRRTAHEAPAFGQVTGLVEAGGRLWMGTIAFPALAHTNAAAL